MIKREIRFVVPGQPIQQQRHRSRIVIPKFNKRPFLQNYDPSAKDKEKFILKCASIPVTPITAPVMLYVKFYFERPKSHFRTGKFAGQLKPDAPQKHTTRPDLSNLVKFVEDAMNKFFFKDDSQIFFIQADKYYTHPEMEACTEIIIKECKLYYSRD
jgi:Holliday junction resolvase RusA-like endonuclease